MASRVRARPAHAPGSTYNAYTKDGGKLITVGNNAVVRIFTSGSDAEPVNIDVPQEAHTALAAHDDFFVTGAEDGSVCKYSLATNSLDELLLRSTLPVRDVAISPDGLWVAVASDELVVKLVSIRDMTTVVQLKEQHRPAKHVAFDLSGSHVAVSCTDGVVYVYSITSEEPKLVKKLDGLIKMLETDKPESSAIIFHPDGRALAAPTATRTVQVVSTSDWQHHKSFQSGHAGDITAAAWSPNGALLASAGADRSLTLWDVRTQEAIRRIDGIRDPIVSISWHPTENMLAYTNNDGELYIHTDVVPAQYNDLLQKTLQAAPLRGEPLAEISNNVQRQQTNGTKVNGHRRAGTPDSLDEMFSNAGSDNEGDAGDDFIVDDDGAGYAEEFTNGNRKRPGETLEPAHSKRANRQWQPEVHPSFQPGSTPWRGNRRYLCLNLTGFIWTVDQDSHHTITTEFYDRSLHRDFHFTDPFLYDKACLSDQGAVFSCPSSTRHTSLIYYRPHETWTARTDWRTSLPIGEEVTSLSLSTSFVIATTSAGYIRIYTLFGLPYRVYRSSPGPIITTASWRDYVLQISNGPFSSTGHATPVISIDNVKRGETHQSDSPLPLPAGAHLATAFWSDSGDPCVYDSTGVLLVCLHWRNPGQAKWVPLLDTTALARLAGGRKDESYWPVAVAGERFHCIILKGGEKYPYFPRPLLSDFAFEVPIGARKGGDEMHDEGEDDTERRRLEEGFVRQSLLLELRDDYVCNTKASASERNELVKRETEVDKLLLQLLAQECREGEERGMKALEIVGLMRDRSGRMLEAAGKIAARFGRDILGDKITALAERRLVGLVDEDDA